MGAIPGRGTKIPQLPWCSQNNNNKGFLNWATFHLASERSFRSCTEWKVFIDRKGVGQGSHKKGKRLPYFRQSHLSLEEGWGIYQSIMQLTSQELMWSFQIDQLKFTVLRVAEIEIKS